MQPCANGAAVTCDDLIDVEAAIDIDKAMLGAPSWPINSAAKKKLRTTLEEWLYLLVAAHLLAHRALTDYRLYWKM